MSERFLLLLFFKDKTITNPINKSEMFYCSDFFKDYKKCRAMYRKGLKSKSECREIRSLAHHCYFYTEEDFEKYLATIFDEKKQYINYLKNEGSILYEYYKSDPTVFSVKKLGDEQDSNITDMNEHIVNK